MATQIMKLMIANWMNELSEKFGRSEQTILERGLHAGDFSTRQAIEINFHDGSCAMFLNAFVVWNQSGRRLAVFTEHCGYFEFSSDGLEIREVEIG
jgi:hypothetical protein